MNNHKKYLLLLFCCLAIFIVPFLSSADQQKIEKIFYINQSGEKKGLISLQKNSDKIDILAPQFYAVSGKFKLVGGLDNNLKKIIKKKKVKVMPLVVNAGFKQDLIHNFLLSEPSQDDVIKSLVVEAKKNNYIGWQFDFENISYLDKDLYSAFVEKSAQSLHENGLILSVAASSRSVDFENTDDFKNWGGAFDYARLANAADFISLMTYDDPNSVGPVASLPFINSVLSYVKDKIPPKKLSLGIPLYYWKWSTNPFKKVARSGTYDGLLYIRDNFRHNLGFDDVLGAAWLTYFWNNNQYQVWYQDKQSFENKIYIINQDGFRGFSAWVLGVEDPEIWSAVSKSN